MRRQRELADRTDFLPVMPSSVGGDYELSNVKPKAGNAFPYPFSFRKERVSLRDIQFEGGGCGGSYGRLAERRQLGCGIGGRPEHVEAPVRLGRDPIPNAGAV